MATRLAEAHMEAERRLRVATGTATERLWRGLPDYRDADLDQWLTGVLPLVNGAQRRSVALTDAYLARFLRRRPLGVDPEKLTGAAVRSGAAPVEVYTRPFATVWRSLEAGAEFPKAANAGLAHAVATAALDVALSARSTFQAVQEQDSGIHGYQRTASGGACAFCQELDSAFLKSADDSPLHNYCGCGLEPLISPHSRAPFLPTGREISGDGFAIHQHGEVGAVLADPSHSFTGPSDL